MKLPMSTLDVRIYFRCTVSLRRIQNRRRTECPSGDLQQPVCCLANLRVGSFSAQRIERQPSLHVGLPSYKTRTSCSTIYRQNGPGAVVGPCETVVLIQAILSVH